MKEIELKFPLLNPEEVMIQLDSIAERVKSEQVQSDTYYIPAHRNFIVQEPISEWLRLRKTHNGTVLNYKRWHFKDGQGTHCDEHETLVKNVQAIEHIFNSLDLKPVIVVDKTRNSWLLDGVEVSIDKVKDLGCFIELEAKSEFKSVEAATKHLHTTLQKLSVRVGTQDFKGYPHLLLEKKDL